MNCLNIRKPTCIVIGDIMLDVQLHGSIEKIANEAPVPVLHVETRKEQVGGCGNVVMNLESLGCKKLFVLSTVGEDEGAASLKRILGGYPTIVPHLYSDPSYCTIVKTRGFSNRKIIFRYDVETRYNLLDSHSEQILQTLLEIVRNNSVDSIILSDYNKGCLTKELVQGVIAIARANSIRTFVDPKVEYAKYTGCTVFKPNVKELRDIFGIHYRFDRLEEIHAAMKEKVNCEATLLTLAENGMSLCGEDGEHIYESTEVSEVADVTGAGDVVMSILAYYYSTMTNRELIKLATWMGTHSVKHIGTYVLDRTAIIEAVRDITRDKVISADALQYLKHPTVLTNGCFDIVHEGHIALFNYCRSVRPPGGVVVVALNGDESIRNLKCPTRPVNNLQARIALLNQISAIDWIVVFTEDTPFELYRQICPTILVKGGDYVAESLIGREFCKEVRMFTYMEGKSTTNIVAKIRS